MMTRKALLLTNRYLDNVTRLCTTTLHCIVYTLRVIGAIFSSLLSINSPIHKMMSSLLSHPINPALLLCLLYALRRILFPITAVPRTLPTECKAGYSWMPRKHTPTLRFTTYTPRTLAKFNGHDGGRVLFAIAGIVFDVTGGKGFYGPGEHLVTFFSYLSIFSRNGAETR
jgi:hypothetical protein